MVLDAGALADVVAGLTVSGVRFMGLGTFREASDAVRGGPVVQPDPSAFMGEMAVTKNTFTGSLWTVTRTLRWHYLHSAVGQGRTFADYMPDVVDNVDAIVKAILGAKYGDASCTGCRVSTDLLTDPADNQFHGAVIEVSFSEFLNP